MKSRTAFLKFQWVGSLSRLLWGRLPNVIQILAFFFLVLTLLPPGFQKEDLQQDLCNSFPRRLKELRDKEGDRLKY